MWPVASVAPAPILTTNGPEGIPCVDTVALRESFAQLSVSARVPSIIFTVLETITSLKANVMVVPG